MSFDPRSLERLRELGRSLPQPLPAPQPPAAKAKAEPKRHKVETEENPEQLFRELMQASPDGTVPEHLLDRLRHLETARLRPPVQPPPGSSAIAPSPQTAAGASKPAGRTTPGRRPSRLSHEQAELYTAFQQLLLEDDSAD
jgi:hypothetical protein